MFRTISAVSRLCRMAPKIQFHVVTPASVCINSVRFKFADRRGGDKRGTAKDPLAHDKEVDTPEDVFSSDILDDK